MSFWDNLQTKLSDPNFQAQLQGFLGGALQASQTTRVPMGYGEALGLMGQGALKGKLEGIPNNQILQNQATESNLATQHAIASENYFRQRLNLPLLDPKTGKVLSGPSALPQAPPMPLGVSTPSAPPDMQTMINNQMPGGLPTPSVGGSIPFSPPPPQAAPPGVPSLTPQGWTDQEYNWLGFNDPKKAFDAYIESKKPYDLAPNTSRMVGNQTIVQAPPVPPQPTPPMSRERFIQAQELAKAQSDAVAGRQLLPPEVEAQRVRIAAAEAKARADAINAPFDPETINFMADQAWAGDKSVFQQMGYGAAGQANRAALRNAVTRKGLAMGRDGRDIAALNAEFSGLQAGERTLGNRTANIEMAVTEAQQMAPLALQASARVNRTQFPTINSILLASEKGTGGEDVVRLGVATNSLINIYARAISPTGVPTVSDKDHARELLDKAWAKGQYAAGVDQMMKELSAARAAPGAVRGEFRAAIGGGQGGAAMVPDAPISPNIPSGGPKIGDVQKGYRFKGGDPANQNSWEKVQ